MKEITFTIIERNTSALSIKEHLSSKTKEELLTWTLDCLNPLFKLVPLCDDAQEIRLQVMKYSTVIIPVQSGRKLALKVHELARKETLPERIFTYRALGHSVATIHVNSHAYGMVLYSLKAYHHLGYTINQLEEICQQYQKRLG